MELPDDILRLIFFFLSAKDKINILKVNNNFRHNVSPISVLIPKMEYYMERIQCIDIKSRREIMLIVDNLYMPYQTLHLSRINPLYCRNIMENTCIVERCREKKIAHIYIRLLSSDCYIKRKIPYCFKCFKIWYSAIFYSIL